MPNLSDAEKLKNVLEAIGENANSLSVALKYKSPQTIYFVLKGENNLSQGMRTRILDKYPMVNANYLTNGILPVLLTGPELQAQMNLLGKAATMPHSMINLQNYVTIPEQLNRIEKKLDDLLRRSAKD